MVPFSIIKSMVYGHFSAEDICTRFPSNQNKYLPTSSSDWSTSSCDSLNQQFWSIGLPLRCKGYAPAVNASLKPRWSWTSHLQTFYLNNMKCFFSSDSLDGRVFLVDFGLVTPRFKRGLPVPFRCGSYRILGTLNYCSRESHYGCKWPQNITQ